MSDVFVSYKAEDRRQVRPLVEALKADGFSVWWDEQIGGGAAWRNSIEAELDAAKCVIVVWSERSAGPGGSFVRDEASRAMERDVYLPIMLDASRLPLGFGETQALPLNGWKGKKSDPRYQAVVGSLRSIIEHKPLPPQSHAKARFPRRAVLIGGSSAFAVAAAGGGWYFFDRSSPSASNSIAVLPFANLSGDPSQAYFSDGMAEELRTSLARLGGLKVIGRTSSEMVRGDDAETAAKKLAVANILTGSVRRSPATIRVTAQLIDGTTGIESWTQDYDRVPGDTIKIQTDIAQSVAQALKIALGNAGRAALTVGGTNNVDAQNLVLQVDALLHSIFNEKRARRGIELLNAAIVRDPNYAGAYARRAVLLNTVSMFFSNGPSELLAGRSQALESANKAISLAPTLGWAHLALAQVRSAQLQMTPAWAEYRKALRFGPSDANTMRLYARFLAQIGRQQEALGLVDQALALDPLSAESYNFHLFVLYHSRRFADAERTERELGIRSPNLFNPPIEYAYCLIVLGQFAAARQSLARAPANNPGRLTGEAILLARTGDRDGARVSIEKLKQAIGQNASYSIAEIHAQLGESEEAFAALDRAFENADWGLISLLTDPFMDPIRRDLRFRAALARLKYP